MDKELLDLLAYELGEIHRWEEGLLRIRTTTKWPFRSLKRALSNYWDTSLWGVPIILGRKNLRTDLLFFSHNILTRRKGLVIIGNEICSRKVLSRYVICAP